MYQLAKVLFFGFLISLLGSLPMGTLNVAAMQISVSNGIKPAILFACGALIVEMGYVRLGLVAMSLMRKQEKVLNFLEWITLGIVTILAVLSFNAALHPSIRENLLLSNTLNGFWFGIAMCAVSPMQIPFWLGWSTVLFSKKILLPKNSFYNLYILGIGIGAAIAYAVFIFGGQLIATSLGSNLSILNWIIGGLFTLTALFQLWKIIYKKDAVHQLEHPEEVTHGLEKNIH